MNQQGIKHARTHTHTQFHQTEMKIIVDSKQQFHREMNQYTLKEGLHPGDLVMLAWKTERLMRA